MDNSNQCESCGLRYQTSGDLSTHELMVHGIYAPPAPSSSPAPGA